MCACTVKTHPGFVGLLRIRLRPDSGRRTAKLWIKLRRKFKLEIDQYIEINTNISQKGNADKMVVKHEENTDEAI